MKRTPTKPFPKWLRALTAIGLTIPVFAMAWFGGRELPYLLLKPEAKEAARQAEGELARYQQDLELHTNALLSDLRAFARSGAFSESALPKPGCADAGATLNPLLCWGTCDGRTVNEDHPDTSGWNVGHLNRRLSAPPLPATPNAKISDLIHAIDPGRFDTRWMDPLAQADVWNLEETSPIAETLRRPTLWQNPPSPDYPSLIAWGKLRFLQLVQARHVLTAFQGLRHLETLLAGNEDALGILAALSLLEFERQAWDELGAATPERAPTAPELAAWIVPELAVIRGAQRAYALLPMILHPNSSLRFLRELESNWETLPGICGAISQGLRETAPYRYLRPPRVEGALEAIESLAKKSRARCRIRYARLVYSLDRFDDTAIWQPFLPGWRAVARRVLRLAWIHDSFWDRMTSSMPRELWRSYAAGR